jgi:hypothetical protein
MEIHSVGAKLFHVDRRVGRGAGRQAGRQKAMMKLTVTFHNFTNVPKNDLTSYEI